MQFQLKEIRKKSHVSQVELADMIGVSTRTIGAWERGENLPDIEQVWNCAEALGSTPNDICGWYLEHPSDRAPVGEAADPLKRQVVDAYDAMNANGRSTLASVARSLAGDAVNTSGEHPGMEAARIA